MITMTLESREEQKKNMRNKTAKPLLWLGMASIVMLFGGLTSAVVVERGSGNWVEFDIPFSFTISIVFILLSSATFFWAIALTKKDELTKAKVFIGLTMALAVAFILSQYIGWNTLTDQGVYFTGPGHATSGSYFYVLTWLHAAHAIGGIISLLVVLVNSIKGIYNSKNLLGLQLSATYWHFLGALWVYLFLFLNYIN